MVLVSTKQSGEGMSRTSTKYTSTFCKNVLLPSVPRVYTREGVVQWMGMYTGGMYTGLTGYLQDGDVHGTYSNRTVTIVL